MEATGRQTRSVREWLMSRSCQSGRPAGTGSTSARTIRAMPAMRSLGIDPRDVFAGRGVN